MPKPFQRDSLSPRALYDFTFVQDVSTRPEVARMMEIHNILMEASRYAASMNDNCKPYPFTKKAFNAETVYQAYNGNPSMDYLFEHYTSRGLCTLSCFSITGGYPRNILLGTNYKTDLDIVTGRSEPQRHPLVFFFKREETESTAIQLAYPGNSMHLLRMPDFPVFPSNTSRNRILEALDLRVEAVPVHTFIYPLAFDFTINLGCISSADGCLYAPPITLLDIQNKIIRPTTQLIQDTGDEGSYPLDISTCIRAIRFALKYDMTIHDMMYRAIRILFNLCRLTDSVDDYTLYFALKHIMEESASFREEFHSTCRKLGLLNTNEFSNFDDYFNFIKDKYVKGCLRQSHLNVGFTRVVPYN